MVRKNTTSNENQVELRLTEFELLEDFKRGKYDIEKGTFITYGEIATKIPLEKFMKLDKKVWTEVFCDKLLSKDKNEVDYVLIYFVDLIFTLNHDDIESSLISLYQFAKKTNNRLILDLFHLEMEKHHSWFSKLVKLS